MRGFDDLVHIFSSLLDKQADYPNVPKSFIESLVDLLGESETALRSFARLLARYPTPPKKLMESFEDLLHRLVGRLDELRPYVFTASDEGIKAFEALLHGLQSLLARFEDLLRRFKPPSQTLLSSYEALIKETQGLLEAFEDVLHIGHGDPDLLESFDALVKEHSELIDSLQELKERLPDLSEALLISDIDVLDGLETLLLSQIDLRGSAVSLPADEAKGLIDSSIAGSKLVYHLSVIISSHRPTLIVVQRFVDLVAKQKHLSHLAANLGSRLTDQSPDFQKAVDDLNRIESLLDERGRALQ